MKKIMVLMVCMVFLVGTIAASSFTFKKNEVVNLKLICLDENTEFCSSSAVCTVSTIDPSGIQVLNNKSLTFNETFFSTIFPTDKFGVYSNIVRCSSSNITKSEFTYTVTADGNPPSDFPKQFFIISLGFILIGVGLIKDRFRLLKSGGSIIIFIMGVLTLYPGYSFIDWSTLMGLTIGTICIGLGFYFLIEDNFSRDSQEERYQSINKEFVK